MELNAILGRVAAGEDLSMEDMSQALETVMRGLASEAEIALLLNSLRLKGETVEEVASAARVLRGHMRPIRSTRQGLLDTCGTGGDGSATFNISTAAALVIASAGVPVAKHGNRKVSSTTGSADVLLELGVNISADLSTVEGCLEKLGICFCFAPLCHASMRHVAAVRQKLGVPTIFNLLGPLANPAGAPFQLLGVGRAPLRPLLASALARLGTTRALVVHGEDGLDELTLASTTQATEIRAGQTREFTWSPEDFGLERASLDSLRVDGPAQSAAIIRRILAGEHGPARDIVVLNAAAGLWLASGDEACGETALHGHARRAEQAIDSGATRELLSRLVDLTRA